jgi:hypothetical protein
VTSKQSVRLIFSIVFSTMPLLGPATSNGGEASTRLSRLLSGPKRLLRKCKTVSSGVFRSKEEEKEATSVDDEFSNGDFAPHPIPDFVSVLPLTMSNDSMSVLPLNLSNDPIQVFLDNGDWINLKALVESDPEVCRQSVSMMFQGRRITCLPLHAVFEGRCDNLSLIECLLEAYPEALLSKEEEGGRLPLHMAAIRGAPTAVMRYLVQASPQSLQMADRQGNLPLHHAVTYSSEAVVELLANLSPDACQHANTKARLPLHLLCARQWDQDSLSLSLIRTILHHNARAAGKQERQGRLPLHLACEQGYPRLDVVELLVESFPAGLWCAETQCGRTPLATYKLMNSSGSCDHEILLKVLGDTTNREMPKKSLICKLFRNKSI